MPPEDGESKWAANRPIQIIVEGNDDQTAFTEVAKRMRNAKEAIKEFEVKIAQGKDKILRRLGAFALEADFIATVSTVVVVVDADQDPDAARAAMQRALANAGLAVPATPSVWAFSTYQGRPIRTRIEILPPTGTGTLEDLVLAGIPPATIQCVDTFLACAASFGTPKPIQLSKAKIQALAATHIHDGYMHLGAALRDGKLPLDHPAMDPLRDILRCL